jgi:hypothetical protein
MYGQRVVLCLKRRDWKIGGPSRPVAVNSKCIQLGHIYRQVTISKSTSRGLSQERRLLRFSAVTSGQSSKRRPSVTYRAFCMFSAVRCVPKAGDTLTSHHVRILCPRLNCTATSRAQDQLRYILLHTAFHKEYKLRFWKAIWEFASSVMRVSMCVYGGTFSHISVIFTFQYDGPTWKGATKETCPVTCFAFPIADRTSTQVELHA